MLGILRKFFGPKVDMGALINDGATIVDVRTAAEYAGGHIKNSINIPLNTLNAQLKNINKTKPVITCCASGIRSAAAKATLKANGFAEVYNAGSWYELRKYEK